MTTLDRQRLLRRLPATRSLAQEIVVLESCKSSNDVARRRLADGESMDGCCLVALEQTGGRGRNTRDWWSGPAGSNLALTLGLRQPQLPAEVFGLLGACALAGACTAWLEDSQQLALKWPNDLLLDGAKVSGFLCEVPADGKDTMLLGLGVNLNAAPPAGIAPYPTACLGNGGIDHTDFLAAWLWRLERDLRHYQLAGPQDFEQQFLSLLRLWAPHGVKETRGGVSGPLLEFSVARGLSWGDWGNPTTKPMGWISSLEALPAGSDC